MQFYSVKDGYWPNTTELSCGHICTGIPSMEGQKSAVWLSMSSVSISYMVSFGSPEKNLEYFDRIFVFLWDGLYLLKKSEYLYQTFRQVIKIKPIKENHSEKN